MEKHDSNDWRVGDLALCTHQGPWFAGGFIAHQGGPKSGGVYTVDVVTHAEHPLGGTVAALGFPEWPDENWSSIPFVKVTPPALDEVDEREHSDLLDQSA